MLILSTPENERGPKPSFLVGDAAYACNDRVITHVTRLLQPADALMKTVSVSSTLTSAWKEIEWAFGVLVHRRGTLQRRCAPTPTRANTNTNTHQHQHAPTPTRANTNTREPTPTRSKANSRQQRHARANEPTPRQTPTTMHTSTCTKCTLWAYRLYCWFCPTVVTHSLQQASPASVSQ